MPRTGNPILRVEPAQTDNQPREFGAFGPPKEIVEVTPQLRQELGQRITATKVSMAGAFRRWPNIPSVVKLTLRQEALAKSHRPLPLLDRVGMHPIGAGQIGELLLPASPQSLDGLAMVIATTQAKLMRANISTIAKLDPYGAEHVLGARQDDNTYKRDIKAWIEAGKAFILESFRHDEDRIDHAVQELLSELLRELGVRQTDIRLNALGAYGRVITPVRFENLAKLAAFPGIRLLVKAPEFSAIDIMPQGFADHGVAAGDVLDQPAPGLPVVGVIDSGTQPGDVILTPWIAGTTPYLLPPDTDYVHGTFVAGLIAGGRSLNGNDPNLPAARAKVHSVSALGTSGSSFGELLYRIDESVRRNPAIKVWNCSLGSSEPGSETAFGHFAQELDAISDECGVLFVISAGNYQTTPLRPWPVPAGFAGPDRISEPAESPRALTIGSVAHQANLVAPHDPSPFSRRGPGPAKTPKPDLTHYGGNCDSHGAFLGTGMRSLLPGGRLGESIGTSFSTPLASVIAAHTWQALQSSGQDVVPELVKALMIHSAALNSPDRPPSERHYHGFGVPESPLETLFCAPDCFTLLFQADVMDSTHWVKTPYPIPACLRPAPDKFRGEIVMTLCYAPPVDGSAGEEYIRANINASLGNYEQDAAGKWHHKAIVPLETPPWADLHEEAQIDHGFKWSPVKVYRKRFTRGTHVGALRLKLELLRRAGEIAQPRPQRAYVLVTLRGLAPDQPVYNDGIVALRQSNWVAQSIAQAVHIHV